MKSDWDPLGAVAGAMSSVVGWMLVIAMLVLAGFCCGYWIGHREFTGVEATVEAFAWVPLVWLGQPKILIPYLVTGLAIYLPLRFQSFWLYFGSAVATFLAWAIVVFLIVEATKGGFLWQW